MPLNNKFDLNLLFSYMKISDCYSTPETQIEKKSRWKQVIKDNMNVTNVPLQALFANIIALIKQIPNKMIIIREYNLGLLFYWMTTNHYSVHNDQIQSALIVDPK